MSTSAQRIAALERQVLTLQEAVHQLHAIANNAVGSLAEEVVRAHARIDHAGDVFTALRKAVTPLRAKSEPASRIPRAAFDRALADLRADADDDRAVFTRQQILDRHAALRALEAQREAAAS